MKLSKLLHELKKLDDQEFLNGDTTPTMLIFFGDGSHHEVEIHSIYFDREWGELRFDAKQGKKPPK